ncbi:hypothetical protein HanXRQr2_Chr16g0745951 [Helianthus annuus]|uniref:Transposase (putative) gypsy type domain-containing protein n=1 Tax=Helianthus annuus TaxID=4232 RepID=A0A9K3DQN6_HELAN|nr:hypothetical protein HanXRQr2_Chr16g0745951 [Helianthus annuus]
MSRKGRSSIRCIITKDELDSFVVSYKIPSEFAPRLPGSNDLATYSPERIVIYTLSFSCCGVRYPLSPFKMALLKHYGIHFSPLHPLAFLRIVHFELSCAAFADGDWFTFEKWKDRHSLPCYSFMPTSTYPKEWKNMFIFVSPSLIFESLPLRDPATVIDDSVPHLSAAKVVLWRKMYEHPIRAFNFPKGVLAMGGLSPLYPIRPKAFYEGRVISCVCLPLHK